jgi:hypothetical protein
MKVAALLLLVIASGTAYAATEELQDANPTDEQLQHIASMLASRSDPDSLAAAAGLTRLRDRAEAEQLAARASAAGPNRPDLLWLHATLCGERPACDRKAIDAKLRTLDPENGITMVTALVEASKNADPAEKTRLLAALAATKRIDVYWNPLVAHLSTAIISTKALGASQSLASIAGVLAATQLPALAPTVALCRGDELHLEGRRAQCQAVARAFQQGDTIIVETVGNRMAGLLWPAGSPEARAADEARRISAYRTSAWGEDTPNLLANDASARRYLADVGRYRREQDLMAAEIVAAGHSSMPPAGWSPASPSAGRPGPAAP